MKRALLPLFVLLMMPLFAIGQMVNVPGDILVMLRPDAKPTDITKDLGQLDGKTTNLRVVEEVSAPLRAWLLHFDGAGIRQEQMLRAVQRHPAVQLAQNNHIVKERSTPDDPVFGTQWHHTKIQSELAWNISTGGLTATGDTIVVCIVENADLPHPDLVGNAWYNRGEIAGNGIDDDGNGYIDDRRGWNPQGNNDNVYSGGHGTQVAGMIGAKGNNGVGVAGINWDIKMMVVTYQSTNEAHVLAAYTYPLTMRRLYNASNGQRGAFVVATNASWGINYGNPANSPLWCAMYDTLGTAGVLNCGATANLGIDIDVEGDLPTACASDFMVSVTNTTSADARNNGAAWGATTIDLGAPGTQVVTTSLGGGTGATSGTSFASPLTAGLIGLLYSAPCTGLMDLVHDDPKGGALYVRQALFEGVDVIPALQGTTVTGGRINAFNSLSWIMGQCGSCPTPFNLNAHSAAIGQATASWSSLATGTYTLRYKPTASNVWQQVPGITDLSRTVTGLDACTAYEFQVRSDCDTSNSDFGPSVILTTEGCCVAPAASTLAVSPSSVTLGLSTVLAANTYDLRYREVGTTPWTEMSGLTTGTVQINGLASCMELEFEFRSACEGSTSDWTTGPTVHITGCGDCEEGTYCSGIGNTGDEWIERFQLGGIDNTSGNNNGYADFTAEYATILSIGTGYPVTFTPGYDDTPYSEAFCIFLDRNEDGSFSLDERVFASTAAAQGPQNSTLTLPADHPQGMFRMRVTMQYNVALESGCGQFSYGEVEDYCATVTSSTGVGDLARPEMRTWPVPADDVLFIDAGRAAVGGMLMVFDGAGRPVLQQRITDDLTSLSTGSLAAGTYVYRIIGTRTALPTGRFHVVH